MVSTLSLPTKQSSLITQVVDYSLHRYHIHGVRQSVFVKEQSIPAHLEMDCYDPISQHVLAWWEGAPVGTGRLAPNGRIGRVAVHRSLRRRGVGLQIMTVLLEAAKREHHHEVHLAAQLHAIKFYERLGFETEGSVFSELGIFHVMMRKRLG